MDKVVKKESFYKTLDEKILRGVIDKFYNDEIGGNENAMMDRGEYYAWKEGELIEYIAKVVLSSKEPLQIEDTWLCLEPKHVRFMGKARVHEIVEHRVKYRHRKEGPWEWEGASEEGAEGGK